MVLMKGSLNGSRRERGKIVALIRLSDDIIKCKTNGWMAERNCLRHFYFL